MLRAYTKERGEDSCLEKCGDASSILHVKTKKGKTISMNSDKHKVDDTCMEKYGGASSTLRKK